MGRLEIMAGIAHNRNRRPAQPHANYEMCALSFHWHIAFHYGWLLLGPLCRAILAPRMAWRNKNRANLHSSLANTPSMASNAVAFLTLDLAAVILVATSPCRISPASRWRLPGRTGN